MRHILIGDYIITVLVIPIILNDMEVITDLCNRISIESINVEALATQLTKLILHTQFLTILSASHSSLRMYSVTHVAMQALTDTR